MKPIDNTFLPYSPIATWVKAKARQDRSGYQKGDDSRAFKKPTNDTFLPYSPRATWVKAKGRQDQAGCQKDDSV